MSIHWQLIVLSSGTPQYCRSCDWQKIAVLGVTLYYYIITGITKKTYILDMKISSRMRVRRLNFNWGIVWGFYCTLTAHSTLDQSVASFPNPSSMRYNLDFFAFGRFSSGGISHSLNVLGQPTYHIMFMTL